MVAAGRRCLLAAALTCAALPAHAAAGPRRAAPRPPAADEGGERFDPHRPGRSLHGRVFHVPQGAQVSWEAWEGRRGGRIEAVHLESEAALALERVGVDTPADRLGPGVSLIRYVLTVSEMARPDSVLGVKVAGAAPPTATGVEEAHDWDFAFTIHVVPHDKYASERAPSPPAAT